jgi:hypothetical protein
MSGAIPRPRCVCCDRIATLVVRSVGGSGMCAECRRECAQLSGPACEWTGCCRQELDESTHQANKTREVHVRIVERTRPPAKLYLTPDEWEDIANS